MSKASYALLALVLSVHSVRADDDLVKQVVNPSVMIQYQNDKGKSFSIGTGTVLKVKGKTYVLTCAHVVEGFRQRSKVELTDTDVITETWQHVGFISEHDEKQTRHKGRVVLYDRKKDLALLETDGKGLSYGTLAEPGVKLKVGEECHWSGAAFFDWNTQQGRIIRPNMDRTDLHKQGFALSGAGWFGHSGSGVYVRRDKRYVLVGVLNAGIVSPKGPSFAIRHETILTFLEGLDD